MDGELSKDYRIVLKEQFATRLRRNPRYSLRSFARDLGMHAAQLSDVLNGKYGISMAKAGEIGRKLGFSGRELEYFVTLAESQHARSRSKRDLAQTKLKSLTIDRAYRTLQDDAFTVISDWHHFAILELLLVKGAQSDASWISKRLGISPVEAELAIHRLQHLGLLEERKGLLRPTDDFSSAPLDAPMAAKRKFHEQVLKKALHSLHFHDFEKRDFSTTVMAIDSKRIPEVREAIKDFRRKITGAMSASSTKDRVYNLSIQFFSPEEIV